MVCHVAARANDMEDGSEPIGPIQLVAPDGEKIWTIVELQGSIESKEGGALNGQELGQITQRPDVRRPVPHAAQRSAASDACAHAGRRGSCRSGSGCK